MRLPILSILAALAIVTAASAQDESTDADRNEEFRNAQEYTACMTLAQRTPEEALGSAEAWEQAGGGDAARHCAAVALIGMGQYADAASRLEQLGTTLSTGDPALAAQILAQAGIAWQAAEQYERAVAVDTAALKLAPDNADILIDRSVNQFLLGKCWESIDDLNAANELSPDRGDILVFRASAYRCVESYELAREDVDRALALNPENLEALLERGTIRSLTGDPDGARADWLKVAEDAAGTPAGDAAQMNLERLDLKVQ
jgi:tetratricopeptide (TPR) repeat protein